MDREVALEQALTLLLNALDLQCMDDSRGPFVYSLRVKEAMRIANDLFPQPRKWVDPVDMARHTT